MSEKINKIIQIIEFVALLVIAVLLVIFKYIPEYKATLGSSDKFIKYKDCQYIMEINISNGPDFMIIMNDKTILSNIIFLNNESLCLYNKNIESTKYKLAIDKLVGILQEEKYINVDRTIEIINYKETKSYEKILDYIKEPLNQDTQVIEKSIRLEEKAELLNISGKTEKDLIENLDMYSKNITRRKRNLSIPIYLAEQKAIEYANEIYDQLDRYARNVENQDKDSDKLPIQLLSAKSNENIIPSSNSWYYIKNHKVYAYIEFTENNYNYNFCYYGSKKELEKESCG